MCAAISNYNGKMKMNLFDDPRAVAVMEQLVKEQGFVSYLDLLMIKEAIASTDMEKE